MFFFFFFGLQGTHLTGWVEGKKKDFTCPTPVPETTGFWPVIEQIYCIKFSTTHSVLILHFSKNSKKNELDGRPMSSIYRFIHHYSVQSFSCVQLFVITWAAVYQTFLSITSTKSLLKLMSIKLVMSSSHLILCHPLLFLPWIFPSIRVFSNEFVLRFRWPKYWSFSFNISPPKE